MQTSLSRALASLKRLLHNLRLPLVVPYLLSSERDTIDVDVERWTAEDQHDDLLGHLSLPQFRSLFYYRLSRGNLSARVLATLLKRLYRPEPSLGISCDSIGPGLYIQHGWGTRLSGVIGANCWVLHDVTVGYVGGESPVLGDNVMLGVGAKVIGGVHVGDGVRVGANAVVMRSVEAGRTVIAPPPRILDLSGS